MDDKTIKLLFDVILGRSPTENEIFENNKNTYSQIVENLSRCAEKFNQLKSLSGEKIKCSVSYSDDDIEHFFKIKDKKIAICLSGHLRDYETNLPSIEKFLIRTLNADVFIHTWDSIGKQIQISSNTVGPIPDESKKDLPNINKYLSNVRKIKIENNSSFLQEVSNFENSKFYLYGMPLGNDLYGGQAEPRFIVSQLYSVNQSYKLMKEWSIETKIEYDYIIKLRSDYFLTSGIFSEDFDFLDKNKKIIFIPNTPYSNHGHPSCCMCSKELPHDSHIEDVCDVFAYGKAEDMEHYFSIYDNLETLRQLQDTDNLQIFSKKSYILSQKQNFILCDIWKDTNYDINCFYPERLFRKHLESFQLKPSKLSGRVIR